MARIRALDKERSMYPFFRLIKEVFVASRQSRIGMFDTHVSHHICWPWDLDLWVELNNGRTLTLYDLGRVPLAVRTGLGAMLRREKWGMTVAGSTTRYRVRVRMFDKVATHSRLLGWDHRFVYVEQSMWNSRGDCTSNVVLRLAMTDHKGIVVPERVIKAMGQGDLQSPELPEWVQAWIRAEDLRIWPPHKA
jgi:acyl-CoA thioesterase FadM